VEARKKFHSKTDQEKKAILDRMKNTSLSEKNNLPTKMSTNYIIRNENDFFKALMDTDSNIYVLRKYKTKQNKISSKYEEVQKGLPSPIPHIYSPLSGLDRILIQVGLMDGTIPKDEIIDEDSYSDDDDDDDIYHN
jgi:hypothetical protein